MCLSFVIVVEDSGKVGGTDTLMQTLLPEKWQIHLSGVILCCFQSLCLDQSH